MMALGLLTDISETLEHPIDHILCRLLVKPLLPFIDYHDPLFNCHRLEELFVDPRSH